MAIISIFSGSYCHGEEIADAVSRRLGWERVDTELLRVAARSSGVAEDKLRSRSQVQTRRSNAKVEEALQMAKEHIDCAVVVKDERLAGIFTFSDVCRSYGELLREIYPRGGGDEAA